MEQIRRLEGCWAAVAPRSDPSSQVGPTSVRDGTAVDAGTEASTGAGSSAAHAAAATAVNDAAEKDFRKEEQAMSLMILNVKQNHMATFRRHTTHAGRGRRWRAISALAGPRECLAFAGS